MIARKDNLTITFDEESHTYSLNNESVELKSVTENIHDHFAPFVANDVAENVLKGRNYKTSKYSGMSKEEIIAKWETDRIMGTTMHARIEKLLNDEQLTEEERGEFICELGQFEKFLNVNPSLEYVKSEFRVFSPEMGLAGTIDYLTFDSNGNATIVDWKRSGKITERNPYRKGKGIFSSFDDCNYNHYSIQLNIYKRILETNYLINDYVPKVVEMKFVVFHPENDSYLEYKVPVIDRIV